MKMTTVFYVKRLVKVLPFYLFTFLLLTSCSESTDEEDEFENWQARNEAYFATLEDSLQNDAANWLRIKCYSLDQETEGKRTDYIYAKVIDRGEETESPMFSDSVRVSYLGRLLPSTSYPEGYPFDSSVVYGSYSQKTNDTTKFLVSQLTDGFATALQHMHRGDYWRIYVPSELGYGKTGNTGIPAYSVLVFELTLVDFCSPGTTMPTYSSREMGVEE